MFAFAKFYIIVSNNSFIIKKEDDYPEYIINLQQFIPNIPAYYHLFDEDKENYIKDIKNQIKGLKIKNATIILPDDCMDIQIDKQILTEFLIQCGVKKIQADFQCFLLNSNDKKYISISRTTRVIVMQYISYRNSISKKYYEKDYTDIEQIKLDMKNLHADCQYTMVPVHINNINNDMEKFRVIGDLISIDNIIANIKG